MKPGTPIASLSLLLFSLSVVCGATLYYVKPMEDTPCPNRTCHTWMQYVLSASQYFPQSSSNITVIFLSGDHSMDRPITFTNMSNLTLITTPASNASILCENSAYFRFSVVEGITINGLYFSGCGNISDLGGSCGEGSAVAKYYAHNITGTLQFLGVTDLAIANIVIENSICDGICNVKPFGEISISKSIFYYGNNNHSCGEVHHISVVYLLTPNNSHHAISLKDLLMAQDNQRGAIYISMELVNGSSMSDIESHMNIEIENVNVSITAKGPVESYAPAFDLESPISLPQSHSLPGSVHIRHCHIKGPTFAMFLYGNLPPVTTEDTYFESLVSLGVVSKVPNLSFRGCNFHDSMNELDLYKSNANFTDCSFHEISNSALTASQSDITVLGMLEFTNNQGDQGGAISLNANSHILVTNSTRIILTNNTASRTGGAIYVDGSSIDKMSECGYCSYSSHCFIELLDTSPDVSDLNTIFVFRNNTAEDGGDDVYGGLHVALCLLSEGFCLPPVKMMEHLFDCQSESGSGVCSVSSDPLRVCFCEGDKPDCLKLQNERLIYPGATFNISLATVGETFGVVKGSVYASFHLSEGRTKPYARLEKLQSTQGTGKGCSVLGYTLFSSHESEILVLNTVATTTNASFKSPDTYHSTVDTYNRTSCIGHRLLTFPISINVTLYPCPTGFTLNPEHGNCDCSEWLIEIGASCDISSKTIHHNGNLWVSASSSGNTSIEGVIVGKFCPFPYCKSEAVDVDLEHPDSQCAFNHSGTLCGGCQQGLSLVLGSPQCLPCRNIYLLLLIPFTLAGLAIVILIKILDLTVSWGTINGLIFYANAVNGNEAVLFQVDGINPLKVFIAWLNLDLGIQTCFINGLTAHEKVWLQFAFPLYIWAIAGVMIGIAHFSSTAARAFGNNSVPVLATLFLLSYAKLLQTILVALSFNQLDYPNETVAVWLSDGSIRYFSHTHTPLLLVALAFLLFLWLPVTAVLLFGPCLQKMGNAQHKVLKVLVKFKPLFDAFFGPFKDKHRYWVGVLLLARIVIQITSIAFATPTQKSNVGLLTLGVVSLTLLIYTAFVGQVYRKWYLALLENSFFVNLNLLALGTLYVKYDDGEPTAVLYISVSIAFAQFLVIVAAHICVKTHLHRKLHHKLRRIQAKRLWNNPGYEDLDGHPRSETAEHPSETAEYPSETAELRESLLGVLTVTVEHQREENRSANYAV